MKKIDPEEAVQVATVPFEAIASMIVSVLEDNGVQAMSSGTTTTGISEGPGPVHVLVHASDAAKARQILKEMEEADEVTNLDWSRVDVHDVE